jgi:eukaryotic-like serine/threonine-protein kinase
MRQTVSDEDLFSAALMLPAEERHPYLARACGKDSLAYARLAALIDVFGNARTFAQERLEHAQVRVEYIGPYRLLRELGEGGCGVVYLAEQSTPVARQVALKIIKPGMDTKALVARFQAEQQLLALMDHPNVAKVFDAGTTASGRPYFVMELVRGIRITDYCNHCRLGISDRLALFTQVCQAIQHAHQKGIIHRDIKPSNVLVTLHDGVPLVKVIDFGIAKATQGRSTDHAFHTAIDQFIGTPAYVSPEQTESSPAGVDTRSDIYSLGVLFYELLTGTTPFDTSELLQVGIDKMRHRIRHEDPAAPSKRIRAFAEDVIQEVAARNNTTRSKLVNQIQGDLDRIVMRCLEKDPARRYQTALELVNDIERYLRHEPVLACPPSLPYVIGKFARRNRFMFASCLIGASFVVFVTGFAVVMSIQAERILTERDRAEREADQAKRVSNVVLNVLGTTDPFKKFDHQTTESEFLDHLARSVTLELGKQPEARARLLEAVGVAYRRRGGIQESIGYLQQAVQTRAQMQPADRLATIGTMTELSLALRISGHTTKATQILDDAAQLAKHHQLTSSSQYAKVLLERGRSAFAAGKLPEARRALAESLDLYRKLPDVPGTDFATVLIAQSNVFQWSDDLAEAERSARQAVAILEASVPAMHPDRVIAEVRVADVLHLQGRPEDAGKIFAEALRKQRQLFGRDSWQVAEILDSLAAIWRSAGHLDEAETFARQAIDVSSTALGERHPTTASYSAGLARTLIAREKYAEAESELRRILSIYAEALPLDHQYVSSAEYFLGEVFLATGRLSDAADVLAASMHRWKRSDAPNWRAARSASALGEALHRLGRTAEARKYLAQSAHELSIDPKADRAAKEKARARAAHLLSDD